MLAGGPDFVSLRPMFPAGPWLRALLLALCSLLGSCSALQSWTELERPWSDEVLREEQRVRVELPGVPPATLYAPRVVERAGVAWLSGGTGGENGPRQEVELSKLAAIEVERLDPWKVFGCVVFLAVVLVALFSEWRPGDDAVVGF